MRKIVIYSRKLALSNGVALLPVFVISFRENEFKVLLSEWTPNTHTYTHTHTHTYIYIYIYMRGAYDMFLDFFRMGSFIDSTHMKLSSPSK